MIANVAHLVHGNDLAVSATGRTTLDAECGSLTRLTNTGKSGSPKMCSKSLRETDRRGGFAFSKRRWRDPAKRPTSARTRRSSPTDNVGQCP